MVNRLGDSDESPIKSKQKQFRENLEVLNFPECDRLQRVTLLLADLPWVLYKEIITG